MKEVVVIHAVMQNAEESSRHRNLIKDSAPTGNAASLFSGGETIHSLLKIPAEKGFQEHLEELNDGRLVDIQSKFEYTTALILDEKGMIE